MARSGSRASAVTQACVRTPERVDCPTCGQRLWVAYHEHRRVVRRDGVWQLTLRVRRCRNQDCAAYHQAYVPEEAGAWALPQAEFGLDVIAFVGQLRYREQRSVPPARRHCVNNSGPMPRMGSDAALTTQATHGGQATRNSRLFRIGSYDMTSARSQ